MVTIIKTSHSIRAVLNYNEQKVNASVAECIGAGNYPSDVDKLSPSLKLNRFIKRLELNENTKRNSVHISLNFDPSENHSKEKLMDIVTTYMDKIGFGNQPYLVYQHHDAGHPHVHVVSVNIERDGKRIDLHHLGIRKSEPARKEIEEIFGLVKAQGSKEKQQFILNPISTGRIQYGKTESKKALSNVLKMVLNDYKYSSLPELNAILKLYNVLADRGSENSRVFQTNGLLYRILDDKGKPTGVPIKASDFYFKPTLKFLAEKFKKNEERSPSDKRRIKNVINFTLNGNKIIPLTKLATLLKDQGIDTVFRRSSEGMLYGITYIDHTTKNVFNGSSLGKEFSPKAIEERCGLKPTDEEKKEQIQDRIPSRELLIEDLENQKNTLTIPNLVQLLDVLIRAEYSSDYLPHQLRNKRSKRRKRGFSNN
ncbi:relaxase/mobilization nuclease domain-containing protein [Flavobacterium agrisoli]|uniref:Relaxase/mobilization nuclease domain-containing protein n=1 Tax=Flavobacterium agrisoli TaxID=2793066 RepID=A0A934PP49_9FLAO|nr:relaxase/mobilization nuclease domain-containing protein [Flavobacterium agrisoli]MBK0371167.1 relaxase/mobilization nuclease domain-containing protein [Flavobacterium agrisoli]